MVQLDAIQKRLIEEIADLHSVPEGAYNFRANGQLAGRSSTANIEIVSKEDGSGIDIHVKPGTKNESVHIPVVLSQSGLKETVYNDFYIGEDADVVIVAGCGIDNCGSQDSEHDGVHRFFVGKNARIKYVEKHYGSGDGRGQRILNPVTEVYQEEGSSVEMEMEQIKGVDSTERTTLAELKAGARLVVKERLMTHGSQNAVSSYQVNLNGADSTADVVSRSVARDESHQTFNARITGNAPCSGHTECDSIIMDQGKILAIPSLEANNVDAMLVHEAAIGKIAGDQLVKLMTLGLTEQQAEEQIINGSLRCMERQPVSHERVSRGRPAVFLNGFHPIRPCAPPSNARHYGRLRSRGKDWGERLIYVFLDTMTALIRGRRSDQGIAPYAGELPQSRRQAAATAPSMREPRASG